MYISDHSLLTLEQFLELLPKEDLENFSFKKASSLSYSPIIIQSKVDNVDIFSWLEKRKYIWRHLFNNIGALLFRGFSLHDEERMSQFAKTVMTDILVNNSEHQTVSTDGKIQTPVNYDNNSFLLWHNENTFNLTWPGKAIFACAKPAEYGGETPIVDSRTLFSALPDKIRNEFINKKVMYVRNYNESDYLGLGWKTIFNTSCKKNVEKQCDAQHIDFEWRPNNKLITRAIRPAVLEDSHSGNLCWINQAQHWHPSCLSQDVREAFSQIYDNEIDYPRICYFGDGTRIDDSYMTLILDLYKKNQVMFPWQQGDLMLVDNILKAHGRNTFSGERKILVTFGDIKSFNTSTSDI